MAIHQPTGSSVHLWPLQLDPDDDAVARMSALLDPDERDRAARFKFPIHRNRFVSARAQLREILSRYTGELPENLVFATEEHGKPLLPAHPAVPFNLSHSESRGILAVSGCGPVGVDLESPGRSVDCHALAKRFFSGGEYASVAAAGSGDAGSRRFLEIWTAKEAVLKAVGLGLRVEIASVDLAGNPLDGSQAVEVPGPGGESQSWWVTSVPGPDGFVAALATGVPNPQVEFKIRPRQPTGD